MRDSTDCGDHNSKLEHKLCTTEVVVQKEIVTARTLQSSKSYRQCDTLMAAEPDQRTFKYYHPTAPGYDPDAIRNSESVYTDASQLHKI